MNKLLRKIFFTILLFSKFCISDLCAQQNQELTIIPNPLKIKYQAGVFRLNAQTTIRFDGKHKELQSVAGMLMQGIRQRTGIQIRTSMSAPNQSTGDINLHLITDTLGDEGYRISVGPQGIEARASRPNGLFYAIQTIFQLLPMNQSSVTDIAVIDIPAVEITDKPRFGWRGLMLDVGRYFYSVDYIKKFIDCLAMHKMNIFHWHLVEDFGWRIEIKKYPKLTEVGAWRRNTNFQRGSFFIDSNPHGGYYTQDDIREVVAYAQARYVTVVPEIELPGHVLSALVAYPELSCTGGPFEFPEEWAIQKDIYCAGKEEVFTFLEDVLSEVVELFPSKIIHIGGDEALKDRWSTCVYCQQRIKNEGLKDEFELQSYFIKRIERFLNSKGKQVIGWDEILQGGLAPNAAVMSWQGIEGGIAAARMHHPVVMCPTTHMYLDHFQGEPYLEPSAIGGHTPLRKVYSYEPIPEVLKTSESKFILGVQGNVWGEFIHSPDKCDYMTFPRGGAVAEVGWSSKENRNWDDFVRRMEIQYERYQQMGINYAKSAYQVYFEVDDDVKKGKSTVTLKTDSYRPEIHYTLNGTQPSSGSPLYKGPFNVKEYITIRAATFKNGEQISPVSVRSIVHFTDTPKH